MQARARAGAEKDPQQTRKGEQEGSYGQILRGRPPCCGPPRGKSGSAGMRNPYGERFMGM